MKLVLKIAAGILLAGIIIFLLQLAFGLTILTALSGFFLEKLPPPKTITLKNPPKPSFNFQTPKIRKQNQTILRYQEEYVPGKSLKECMGKSKELNEDVLRCRHGYKRKVPIYNE